MGSTNIDTAKKRCLRCEKSESSQESCPLKMKDIISFISLYLFIGIKAYQVRDFDITNNGLQCKTPCGKNGLHEGRYWCHTEKSWDFCDFKHKVAMVVEYLNPRQNAVVGSSIPPPLSTVVQAIAQVAPAPPPPAGGGNACVANCPVAPAPVPPGRRRRRQTQNYNVKELNYRLRSLIRSRIPKPSYL